MSDRIIDMNQARVPYSFPETTYTTLGNGQLWGQDYVGPGSLTPDDGTDGYLIR
jgi:hypothetical protein